MYTQKNPLVSNANSSRRQTVKALEGAVRNHVYGGYEGNFVLPTSLKSELTTVAPRLTSLGFSEHDLRHFANFYAGLAEKKVEAWQWQNRKVLRMERPSKEAIAERDRRYLAVRVVRIILDVLDGEIARRERVQLDEIREIEAQRAEIEAKATEQAAEVEALVASLPEIKLRAPKRKSKSIPKKRDDFSKVITSSEASNPFEALKGEVTARQRSNWQARAIKKAEVLEIAGCSAEELDSARLFAQKMGTDEIMELESGVIRMKLSGNSVRYEYYGEVA